MRAKVSTTWTTDPLFIKQGTDYYFYQNDHLGTPQKLTAINGAVVWTAKYSSFLKADVDSASIIENNLRVAGQYFDQETGLHYNYFRYYDSTSGRYLTPDPIGLAGGINLYGYVLNDPINLIDPIGLECKIESFESLGKVVGDPRLETQKIGYFRATGRMISWHLLKLFRYAPPVPDQVINKTGAKKAFKYRVRYTQIQRRPIGDQ